VPAELGRLNEQRGERLHPPVDRDMIDLDASLGQQLLSVPVRSPYRKYQRTATVITSGGNRNPAKLDLGAGSRTRQRRINTACPKPQRWTQQCRYGRCSP
jgi:hypothetical protein